jgi:hypothetical protein
MGFMWHKYAPMKIAHINPEEKYHFPVDARISPSNLQNFNSSTSSDTCFALSRVCLWYLNR